MARNPLTTVSARAAEPRPGTGRRPTLSLFVISLRPEQWTKNLLLFAGLIFGGRLLEVSAVLTAGEMHLGDEIVEPLLFIGLFGLLTLAGSTWSVTRR